MLLLLSLRKRVYFASPRSIAANGEGRRLYHPSSGDEDEDASLRNKPIHPEHLNFNDPIRYPA